MFENTLGRSGFIMLINVEMIWNMVVHKILKYPELFIRYNQNVNC